MLQPPPGSGRYSSDKRRQLYGVLSHLWNTSISINQKPLSAGWEHSGLKTGLTFLSPLCPDEMWALNVRKHKHNMSLINYVEETLTFMTCFSLRGVPLGSIMGPLLFSRFYYFIKTETNITKLNVQCWADAYMLYVTVNLPYTLYFMYIYIHTFKGMKIFEVCFVCRQ